VLITTIPFADKDKRPLDLLKNAGVEIVINPLGRKLKEKDLLDIVPGVDVLIAGTEPITDAVLEQASSLKLISRVGIGLDSVDLLAAKRRGIKISYTPDGPSPAVAELTIGLMLNLLRSVHLSNTRIHRGGWHRYFGRRLSEVTVGIIGVGRIGSRVIRHLAGFECQRVLINDINLSLPLPEYPNCKVERVNKDTIYREADIISLHVPLTNGTRNLISKNELSLMKPEVLLVNTARGGIVNEQDLFENLKAGCLGGAAIDVFEEEPYRGKLVGLDKCLLTAHMGSMSIDCRTRMEIEATEETVRFIMDQPLESLVPEDEYKNQSMVC
jgi:D-3-phosphoglycerate dehydrogenase